MTVLALISSGEYGLLERCGTCFWGQCGTRHGKRNFPWLRLDYSNITAPTRSDD